jgi:hypothetical protein
MGSSLGPCHWFFVLDCLKNLCWIFACKPLYLNFAALVESAALRHLAFGLPVPVWIRGGRQRGKSGENPALSRSCNGSPLGLPSQNARRF